MSGKNRAERKHTRRKRREKPPETDKELKIGLGGYFRGINESEERALKWLVDDVGLSPRKLERLTQGVDFVYDDRIGLEIKGNEGYNIRQSQLADCSYYDAVYFIVSTPELVSVERVVYDVDMNPNNDGGQLYNEMVNRCMGQ